MSDAAPIVRSTFRAMGTDVVVLVHGRWDGDAEALGAFAVEAVERLEARWSRFRPSSDVSMLNAAAGHPVVVAPETFELVTRAIAEWHATDGRYDPTILPALVRAGYDRDFEEVPAALLGTLPAARPSPGCEGIVLDAVVGAIQLPPGVAIDLGGIGKGRAADRVARDLVARDGVEGALVDLGGDLRAIGVPARPAGWQIEADDPLATGRMPRLTLRAGGIATSTRLRRRWTRDGGELHHLIDPRTGEPAATGLASVTVVAGSACRAEVLAKAAFVAGPADGAALVAAAGATGLLVTDDGRVEELPGLAPFRG